MHKCNNAQGIYRKNNQNFYLEKRERLKERKKGPTSSIKKKCIIIFILYKYLFFYVWFTVAKGYNFNTKTHVEYKLYMG